MTIGTQRLKLLRGNTAASSAFTGLQGELIFDTELWTLRLQDGVTPGGHPLATYAQLANISANINANAAGSDTQIQFNDNGAFAGHPNFTFDKNTDTLRTPDNLIVDNIYSVDSTTVHVHDDLETFGSFTAVGMYLAGSGSLINLPNNIVDLNSAGNLQLEADGRKWVFTTSGNLVFPDNTKQSTAYPGLQILNGYAPLNDPTFTNNVTVAGNLIVLGNVTYVTANNLTVNNSIIYLAEDNPTNSLDIGLIGSFTDNTKYQHSGLIRQASTNTWKLFSNVTAEPGTTVDFTDAVYDTLQLGNLVTTGTINSNRIINSGDVNLISESFVQVQYDPSGNYDPYTLGNGSWFYIAGPGFGGGLVFQSNITGNTHAVTLTDFGDIVADGSITFNGNLFNGAKNWNFGSNGYLTTESLQIQGYLKGVDGSTGTTGQVLTRQSNGGVAWDNGGAASTGNIRFSNTTIHAVDYSPVSIQTTGDLLHWWSEYGELLYNTQDTWGSSVEYDSTGNVYVVGGTYHDDGDGNSNNIKSILLKYNTAGGIEWSKAITDPDLPSFRGEGIWIDSSNNSYIIFNNSDTNWSYIVKMDPDANIIWQIKIDPGSDGGLILMDIDGSDAVIYVVGGYNHYVQADNRYEIWAGAFSTTDGSCVWQRNYQETADNQTSFGIAYNGDGGVFITGQMYDGDVVGSWGIPLVSIDAVDGSVNWGKQIATNTYPYGFDVATDNVGNIYIAGINNNGMSLVKFDTAGNTVWQKIVNQDSSTYGFSLDIDSDNNVYITGSTSDTANTNFRDAWLIIKFDLDGNLLWQRSFGSGLRNTFQWYYDGHKEIALHGNVFAVAGYTYAGPHYGTLNNSAMLLAQLPTDGSKTGTYSSFSYLPTDFTVSDDTFSAYDVTFTSNISSYTITTPGLQIIDNDEDSSLYPFAGDTWNFNSSGVLELPAGGDIVDSTTGNTVLNVLRSGVHEATMNSVGVVVDETGRSITGEFNGHITPGHNWSNVPLQIRHATGYKQLFNVGFPQDWLQFADVATQIGVAYPNWITGMIIEFQAFANGQIQDVNWTTSYMTGQIIIASSGNGRMSLTHSEAGIANFDGSSGDLVWSGMDLWIKDLSDGSNPKIAVGRTDGYTLDQLDIQWTARVFVNPAEYFC